MSSGHAVAGMVPTGFIEAMAIHGLAPDPARIVPGEFFRFPGQSGKRSNLSGWGKLFADGEGGVFGDYASGLRQDWQARKAEEMTKAELTRHRQRVAKAHRDAQASRRKEQGKAASYAALIWEESSPASPVHPYLQAKGIPAVAERLRLYAGPLTIRGMKCDGALLVPAFDQDNKLSTLSFISPDGEKRFLPRGRKGGCFLLIGGEPAGVVCIAEGLATAASIEAATGHPVAVAFDAGNLLAVARIMRERYQAARLVLCADNDAHEDGKVNTGIEAAKEAAAAVAGAVAIPDDTAGGKLDFNDLYLKPGGEDLVKAAIAQALAGLDQAAGEPILAADDSIEDTLKRLAGLSLIEYDRIRQTEAERLGVRAVTLDKEVARLRGQERAEESGSAVVFDEVEPWPEKVAGAALLDDLAALCRRFVILPRHADKALALWCCLSYLVDAVDVLPILNVTSPEKRCGKSTLLSVIIRLVHRPLLASNITPSAMFRAVDLWRPTLIIDEADTFITPDNEDLRGIINSGHTRDTAFVIRTCGDSHEPRRFSTWAAKAIAGIGNLPGTVRDRSVEIELKRRTCHEPIEKLRLAGPEIFETIRRRCARFAADIRRSLLGRRPEIPAALHDRAADNWWPLLAIAEIAGEGWPAMARDAALALAGAEQEAVSINVELLADIKDIFDTRGVDRISTAMLIEDLCADSDKPWATWNKGKPISPHQLSRRLKEFSISPSTIRLPDWSTPRGYHLHQFNDAFCRYIRFQSATTPQVNTDAASRDFQSATKQPVLRIGKTPNPAPAKGCGVVADTKGENEDNESEGGIKWARL